MIGRLRGIVLEKQPPLVLLEKNGVGYEIHMPTTCFYKLPDIGQEVVIFTQLLIRENMQILYGFNSNQERMLFRELIRTNSIGPKLALVILSNMTVQQFINVIAYADQNALIKLSGIGKKTAERLIIEMKDRFKRLRNLFASSTNSSITTSSTVLTNKAGKDAVAALVVLGYQPQEASLMVNKVATPDASSETLIRKALCFALRGN